MPTWSRLCHTCKAHASLIIKHTAHRDQFSMGRILLYSPFALDAAGAGGWVAWKLFYGEYGNVRVVQDAVAHAAQHAAQSA